MIRALFTTALLLSSITGIASAQQVKPAPKSASKTLPLGTTYEGELAGDKTNKVTIGIGNGGNTYDSCYATSIPVSLKAGQDLSITVTGVGKDRLMGILVMDPSNKRCDKNGYSNIGNSEKKTISIKLDEVNAKGVYTIIVVSDAIGPFTLKATSETAEETRESLEFERDQLKKKLAAIEEKLKAMDAKPKK